MPAPKTPLLATDCVVIDSAGRVVLIQRKNQPFKGSYALPGGFVDQGESVEDSCRRELMEETGLKAGKLQLVGVYSDPKRDPRRHTCSVVFLTRIRGRKPTAGDDAATAEWMTNPLKLPLAFDHNQILRDALKLAKPIKSRTENLPANGPSRSANAPSTQRTRAQ